MRRLVLFFALLLIAGGASAQTLTRPKLKLGIKGGLDYHSNDFRSEEHRFDIKSNTGWFVGLEADLKWNRWGIHPELLFSHNALDVESPTGYENKIKLNKVDLPILIEYELWGLINLQAGPYFALYTKAKGASERFRQNMQNITRGEWELKRPGFGYAVGAEARLWKLHFTLRYYGTFGNGKGNSVYTYSDRDGNKVQVDDEIDGSVKMSNLQFGIGWYF